MGRRGIRFQGAQLSSVVALAGGMADQPKDQGHQQTQGTSGWGHGGPAKQSGASADAGYRWLGPWWSSQRTRGISRCRVPNKTLGLWAECGLSGRTVMGLLWAPLPVGFMRCGSVISLSLEGLRGLLLEQLCRNADIS